MGRAQGAPSRIVGVLGIFVLLGATKPAGALSCKQGHVSVGDRISEVRLRCGDPSFWDQRIEEFSLTTRRGGRIDRSRTVDEWTYDLGPGRLMRTLIFHDGRLVKIHTEGYGGKGGIKKGDRPGLVSVGETRAQVLLRWGDPAHAEQYHKTRTVYVGRSGERLEKDVEVDVYTYDFGPDRLIRILTFHDGRLVRKRTAGRGTTPAIGGL